MTLEIDAETYTDDHNIPRRALAKASWRGCTMASFEALQEAAAAGGKAFVWPDEGAFKGESWVFNDEHKGEFEPLAIDIISASMLMKVHDAMSPENQDKFRDWVAKDRAHFAWLWEFAQKTVTITGFTSRKD